MKRSRLPLLFTLVVVMLSGVACEQTAPDGETVTPPIVPGETDGAGDGQAYPPPEQIAPDDAYPSPGAGDGEPIDVTPEPTPLPTPAAGDGDGDQGGDDPPDAPELPSPVEPEIRAAAGTVEDLPVAGLIPPPTDGPSTVDPGSTVSHTVSPGEWLLQIARCYGTTVTAIRQANFLPNPDYLLPGTVLSVPNVASTGAVIGPPCVVLHLVAEGETWESLAVTYDTTASVLQRANPGPLTAGRQIFVPATGADTAGTIPQLTNHLLFISDGNLAIWRATDSQVEVTVDNDVTIQDVATNEDGRFVLARQTRDGNATTEVALIDTQSRTSLVLETGLPPFAPIIAGIDQMVIAPDGGWGVYASRQGDAYRLTSFQTAAPETLYVGPALPLTGADDPSPFQLFAGADDINFLVSSTSGLHEYPYSLDLTGREMVELTGDFEVDPVILLLALGWDPGGRYLMANGGFLEGGAVFVIDGETGEMVQLPGSEGYVTAPGVSWTAAGNALVIQPTGEGDTGPTASLFSPDANPGLTLTPAGTDVLALLSQPAQSPPLPGTVILAPVYQAAAGTIHLAIQGVADQQGVWRTLDSNESRLFALGPWPEEAYQANWANDLSGVLATRLATLDEPPSNTYVPLDGQGAFDLSGWLDGVLSDFHWLTP